MQNVTNAAQIGQVFGALLQGVRACAPKCTQCHHPLGDEQEQTHRRAAKDGAEERVCHRCFIGDIAEALVNKSPGLLAPAC